MPIAREFHVPPLSCPHCAQVFTTAGDVQSHHLDAHERPFPRSLPDEGPPPQTLVDAANAGLVRGEQARAAYAWTHTQPTVPGWYAFKYPFQANRLTQWDIKMLKIVMYDGEIVCEGQGDDGALVELTECDQRGLWKGPLDLEAL